jgi:phosphoribosylformylglycinamidine (FGAM) synthase-like amidotransferase family enzyme
MPHPERHILPIQHPRWAKKDWGEGLKIFKNGVEYIKNNF